MHVYGTQDGKIKTLLGPFRAPVELKVLGLGFAHDWLNKPDWQ